MIRYGGLETAAQRATVGKWIVWANATLDPILFKENENGKVGYSCTALRVGWKMWEATRRTSPLSLTWHTRQVIGTGAGGTPKGLVRLESMLEGKEWLEGDAFSVADVAVGAYLLYAPTALHCVSR